ncbi:lipopolysaccharide biosynthesis protein [Cutibacterium equinum]|uniref:Lipopolysaccharide biosynthesis protein n=1 Tax=Cutibacterium equinum TaxID=3016342 RepID=A0ABY7QYK4_9ACTN|nr:lipopolysaccharide biosynthesis protein [Cutibacterium equinum]WCC80126.1 lipopolysaccharide biosynthesis protein [Cutibacterium equinum]
MSEARASLEDEFEDLGSRTRKAGYWALAGQVVKALIQVVTVVVLSRLLTPDDYGIFGMVMAFVALTDLFRELGLSAAAIQAKQISAAQRSNLWWINTAAGASLSLLSVAAAPLVAWLFAEPRLTPYVWAIGALFLISGMSAQYSASLQRQLRQKTLQVINISAQVIALVVTIVLAALGWGAWALIVQSLLGSATTLVLLVLVSKWWPQRWDRNADMRGFFRFGFAVFGYSVVSYLANYIVNLSTGRFFGARELGSLTRGTQLVSTPVSLMVAPVSNLAFVTLSKVQDDAQRLRRYSLLWQQTVGYAVALLCGGLLVVSPSLVPLALGDGWSRTVGFVQLLCISTALGYVPLAAGWLYQSLGRPDIQLRISLVFTPIRVVVVLLAAMVSVEAVLWANIAVSMVTWPVSYTILGRTTRVEVRPLVRGVLRSFVVGGLPAALLLLARWQMHTEWPVIVDLLLYGGAYVVLATGWLLVPPVRREIWEVKAAVLRTRKQAAPKAT